MEIEVVRLLAERGLGRRTRSRHRPDSRPSARRPARGHRRRGGRRRGRGRLARGPSPGASPRRGRAQRIGGREPRGRRPAPLPDPGRGEGLCRLPDHGPRNVGPRLDAEAGQRGGPRRRCHRAPVGARRAPRHRRDARLPHRGRGRARRRRGDAPACDRGRRHRAGRGRHRPAVRARLRPRRSSARPRHDLAEHHPRRREVQRHPRRGRDGARLPAAARYGRAGDARGGRGSPRAGDPRCVCDRAGHRRAGGCRRRRTRPCTASWRRRSGITTRKASRFRSWRRSRPTTRPWRESASRPMGFHRSGSRRTRRTSSATTASTSGSASTRCAGAFRSSTTRSAAFAADVPRTYSVGRGLLTRRPRREIAWVASAATPIATSARSAVGIGRTADRNWSARARSTTRSRACPRWVRTQRPLATILGSDLALDEAAPDEPVHEAARRRRRAFDDLGEIADGHCAGLRRGRRARPAG